MKATEGHSTGHGFHERGWGLPSLLSTVYALLSGIEAQPFATR